MRGPRRRLPALVVLAALALTGCGGDDEEVAVPTATTPTATQTTQTTPPTQTQAAPAPPATTTAAPGGGSGGTPAPPGGSGGTPAPPTVSNEEAQRRFEEFCRRNPDQCGE